MSYRSLLFIFVLAFLLNFVWEELHSALYIHYQGEEITHLILLRAALFDAAFITLLGVLVIFFKFFRRHIWLAPLLAALFAICLELFALATGRWAYNELMPIIPFLGVGLTPTIQLGLLSYVIFRVLKLDSVDNSVEKPARGRALG